MSCHSFGYYFNENLKAAGFQPWSISPKTASAILGHVAAIAVVVENFGPSVTLLELVKAGLVAEKSVAIVGVGASFYLGYCVGSAFVASTKLHSCARHQNSRAIPKSRARSRSWRSQSALTRDALAYATAKRLYSAATAATLRQHPEIYNGNSKALSTLLQRIRMQQAVA